MSTVYQTRFDKERLLAGARTMVSKLNLIPTLYSLLRHSHVEREKIVSFQNRQLRRLVTHAYENVPYYSKLFDRNGIKPQDIRSVEDLSIIPITTKKDLQSLPYELFGPGLNPIVAD